MAIKFVSTHGDGTTGSGPVVVAGIPGGTDRLYIVTGGAKNNDPRITSITGGGLTWIDLIDQCGGRSQTMLDCWYAIGSPGAFSATVTFDNPDSSFSVVVDVFDGADTTTPIRNEVSQNTNGVSGACSGGTDDAAPLASITIDNPASSVAYAIVQFRNRGLTQDANYTTRGDQDNGSSGDQNHIVTSTRENLSGSPQSYAPAVTGGDVDWETIGFEIVAAGVTMQTFGSVLGKTLTSGAGFLDKGAFVQFTFNAVDTKWINVMLQGAFDVAVRFDIANFAGTVIYSNLRLRIQQSAGDRTTPQIISLPLDLGGTSGVSLRIADTGAGAMVYNAGVWLSDQPFQRAVPTLFQSSGAKAQGFTGPTSDAIAFVFGPFLELIPALAFEAKWGSFQFSRNHVGGGSEHLMAGFQIATGPIGNETVQMDTMALQAQAVSSGKLSAAVYDVPVLLTSGERVSVRVAQSIAGARDYGFGVTFNN